MRRLVQIVFFILFLPLYLNAQAYYHPGDTIRQNNEQYICFYPYPESPYLGIALENLNNRFVKQMRPTRLRYDVSPSRKIMPLKWPPGYKHVACILKDLISSEDYAALDRNWREGSWRNSLSCHIRTDWKGNVIDVVFMLPQNESSQKILTPYVLSEWERSIKSQSKFPALEKHKDYDFNYWQMHLTFYFPCDRDPALILDSIANNPFQ